MNNNNYIGRTHHKFESVLNFYAAKIFKPVLDIENVLALETKEHFRTPPEKSAMHPIEKGTKWGEEYGNIWLRCEVTVPEECEGHLIGAVPTGRAREILCFKNGEPAGIINSKNRFIGGEHSCMIISGSAKAGEKIDLAFECYAGHTEFGRAPYESYMRDEDTLDSYNLTFEGVQLVVLDEVINNFVFDVATVLQLSRLPGENYASMKAHQALIDASPTSFRISEARPTKKFTPPARKYRNASLPLLKKAQATAPEDISA